MSTEPPAGPSAPEDTRGAVPADRYGKAPHGGRRARRGPLWLAALAAVLVGGVIAFIAYRNLGSTPIEASRTTFRQLPGNALELTISVERDEPQRAGVCVVRVRSIKGVETGRREVLLPPGAESVTTVVKSTEPPVTASVVGCTYNVPPYMSTLQRPME